MPKTHLISIIILVLCLYKFLKRKRKVYNKYPSPYPYVFNQGNATAVLTRGYTNYGGYRDLINRNKAISKQHWARNYDHLIFHEGNITILQMNYIKQRSNIPLKFISVKQIFDEFKKKDGISCHNCPSTYLSKRFPYGYKAMCYFWFVMFPIYCSNYNHILRVDEDCTLICNQPEPAIDTVIASPYYQGMDWGGVIKGMDNFFLKLSKKYKYNWKWNSPEKWRSPYTNVLWISVKWALSEQISIIRQEVIKSQCIISNRWGDLPLWGATCKLVGVPECNLDIKYFHGSHNKMIV